MPLSSEAIQSLFLSPEQISLEYIQEGDDSRSLSNASARCIFQDSFDNIWIGTWGGGINFISRKPPLFTTLSYSPIPNNENSLNNKVASSLCTDRQGRIWIGTDGGGINVFEGDKRIAIYKKETGDIPSNFILTSLQDSKGNLWFGSFKEESVIMTLGIKGFVPSPSWDSTIRMSVRSTKILNIIFG